MAVRRIFYATNRRHTGGDRFRPSGYGPRISDDGIENLRLGKVTLETSKREIRKHLDKSTSVGPGDGNSLARYFETKLRRARVEAYPEALVTASGRMLPAEKRRLGSLDMFEDLRRAMGKNRDVLVYVHGYGISWKRAVGCALSLQEMLNRKEARSPADPEVVVLLFTWPSDGKYLPWTSYRSDRMEAAGSGYALGRGILKLRDYLQGLCEEEYCEGHLHLLCHSMGSWVLENALQRILEFSGPGRLPRVIESAFLCSPDVDDTVFDEGQPLRPLLNLAKNVTIYFNRGDVALRISDHTKGHPDRLGTNGVARPQFLHKRLHQVDCSDVVGGFVEHEYYMNGRVNLDVRQSIDDAPQDAEIRARRADRYLNSWFLE